MEAETIVGRLRPQRSIMFEKEFREWFESNKKWLFSSDHLQAAYFAWCAGVQQQQAAQQSVQPTIKSVGSAPAVVVESKVASIAESG